MTGRTTYLIIVFNVFFICHLFSQSRKDPIFKTRIGVSPVLSFYKSNPRHTNSTKPKMAFNISCKEEIKFGKKRETAILVGLEYMIHGLSFDSYYFYLDSLKLYTPERLKYTYNLKIYELNFPIQLKYAFQKETNAVYSSYIFGGYNLRWLMSSQLQVTDNGNEIVNKRETVSFKIPLFMNQLNSFLTIGAGFQRNKFAKQTALFLECQFKYGLSPIYMNDVFTPSSLYINSHFLLLTVGVKI